MKNIKTNVIPKSIAVLGTYEGECADANITNKNGLDITREVWENVFSSDDYRQAIDLGWYIGYLGHPEDPNCMDFKNACIVMTEGSIDEAGKVHGKFNLIDTPVGRIVKAFQDAGVTFGISVRGAGDIIDNSVDPDTFVFRGFDLVTFPAFPESIPTYTQIAASSDAKKQAKYKIMCSAIKSNVNLITSPEVLNTMQPMFAKQSDEYKMIQDRIDHLSDEQDTQDDELDEVDTSMNLLKQKVQCMTQLYFDKCAEVRQLKQAKASIQAAQRNLSRTVKSLQRMNAEQIGVAHSKVIACENRLNTSIAANTRLKDRLNSIENSNLKYKQNISASHKTISEQSKTINDLKTRLNETVNETRRVKSESSNLGDNCTKLRSEINECRKLLSEYQQAYSSLYASALGVDIPSSYITATTSVSDIKKAIDNCNQSVDANSASDDEIVDILDDDETEYNADLVTL